MSRASWRQTIEEALRKFKVVPQGLQPALILLDLMYGLKARTLQGADLFRGSLSNPI